MLAALLNLSDYGPQPEQEQLAPGSGGRDWSRSSMTAKSVPASIRSSWTP